MEAQESGTRSESEEEPAIKTITLTVNGLTFNALAAGDASGELVLLLHGFPQTSYEWRYALRALARAGYRAVAPDQRGYSEGARPTAVADYAVSNLVRDVVGLADALGARRFHLVGHDWGAVVAWATAGFLSERVQSLTAVSTAHPQLIAQLRAMPGSCQASATAHFVERKDPSSVARMLADDAALLRQEYEGLPDDAIKEYVRVLGNEAALDAAMSWYRANIDPPDARPPLPPVGVPTLYVWSDEDPTNCRATAEANADFVTGPYTFEEISGVDHWLPERAPEAFHTHLLAHLAAHGGA